MYATVSDFNNAPRDQVVEQLMVCAPILGWAQALAEARPFDLLESLLEAADDGARCWTDDEILAAVGTHASLGQKPQGQDASSAHSRSEQSALGSTDVAMRERLLALQQEYREHFGHIFLIRAAGRGAEEILSALEYRLTRSPEDEVRTAGSELREIALLRLRQLFS